MYKKKGLQLKILTPLVFALVSGCVHIDLSKYPVASRSLFIHNFTNDSFEPDINREVFQSTRNELGRRKNFIVQREKTLAKLHLYGSIIAFQKKGLMYDDLRSPTRLSILGVCKIRLYRSTSTGRELLFSKELASRIEVSLETGSLQTQKRAKLRLSRLLAQKIATALEKEFINTVKQNF